MLVIPVKALFWTPPESSMAAEEPNIVNEPSTAAISPEPKVTSASPERLTVPSRTPAPPPNDALPLIVRAAVKPAPSMVRPPVLTMLFAVMLVEEESELLAPSTIDPSLVKAPSTLSALPPSFG